MAFDPRSDDETPLGRVVIKIQKWCHKHWIPYIHGCIWDRHCRYWCEIRRVSLHWGPHMWTVDLPGHDKEKTYYTDRECTEIAAHQPAKWQLKPHFMHFRSPGGL